MDGHNEKRSVSCETMPTASAFAYPYPARKDSTSGRDRSSSSLLGR